MTIEIETVLDKTIEIKNVESMIPGDNYLLIFDKEGKEYIFYNHAVQYITITPEEIN